jgi:NADH-quinone oxidoreductase subunit M
MVDFLDLLFGSTVLRMVLLPAVCALPLLLFRPTAVRGIRLYLLAVSALHVAVTGVLLSAGWRGEEGFGALRDVASDGRPLAWIPRYGIRFDLGVDGISMPLVALTSLLLPIVVLASWQGIEKHWRSFGASLLLLTSGILGALCAFDLFVFYVFWELMLVPMYLIIGIWGGERRIYAAIKFFLYTMAGSLLMLLAILWLAWTYHELTGVWTFSYENLLALDLPVGLQLWLFGAFAVSFAIKVPLVPFHTWLPDAHVEAPTAGSVVLAGVLLKLGTYGLLRFALPLFPHAWQAAQPVLVVLSVVGILYGGLVAWAQDDMKKLIAYSSVAHLGFVVLGLAAADAIAWDGALLQMVNHGLSTGALFLLVGMLYERRHTKKFDQFGGLAAVMPKYAFALAFAALASVGLPGLNGFVGEFLILAGSYRAGLILPTVLATAGVVVAAVYLFKMLHLTLWGPITHEENRGLADLSLREVVVLAPLCLLMLAIGLAPEKLLAASRPELTRVLATYEERSSAPAPERPALRPAGTERR